MLSVGQEARPLVLGQPAVCDPARRSLPWRLDEEGGGIDCTATDGAGAGLFATGTMDFTLTRRFTDSIVSGDTRLAGTVTDTSGGRWLSDVRYKVKNTGGHDLYVQPNIRLVPLG